MGIIILGIGSAVYAAFTLTAAVFRGKIGFTTWLFLSIIAIIYLKLTKEPFGGEVVTDTWLLLPAIIGFAVGMMMHILRVVSKNSFLPLILIPIVPLLLVNNMAALQALDSFLQTI